MRKVYHETDSGPGDGLAFYFFFAVDTVGDITSRFDAISRDVAALNRHGYRVVVETTAAFEDLRRAIYDEDPDTEGLQTVGFLWSGGANDQGQLRAADGHWIGPDRIDRWQLGRALSAVVFANSYKDAVASRWAAVTRGATQFGWVGDPTTLYTPPGDRDTRVRLNAFLTEQLRLTPGELDRAHAPRRPTPAPQTAPPKAYASAFGAPRHRSRQEPRDVRRLMEAAASLLNVRVIHSPQDRLDYVELRMTDERVQAVWLFQKPHQLSMVDPNAPLIMLESDIGPLRPPANLQHLMETASNLDLGRIVIRQGNRKMIAVQVGLPASTTSPELLASAIVECGRMADWLEYRIYGYDKA